MYKVEFRTNAERYDAKIVDGNTTIKDFINEYGGAVGTVTLNGVALMADEMEETFESLAEEYTIPDGSRIILFDSPKTANA